MNLIQICLIAIFLFTISCSGVKKIEKKLHGTWVLQSVNEEQIKNTSNSPTAVFDCNSYKLSGVDGCNRYNTSFKLSKGNKIEVSPISKTKMMCVGVMDFANQFEQMMRNSNYITIDSNVLKLLNVKKSNELIFFKSE